MGGAEVAVSGLTWRPVRRREPVLSDVELEIPAGQRVLLVGPNGSGKSTLLRAMAGVLLTAADGDLSGELTVQGAPAVERRGRPGLVLQDPTAGLVAATVGRDVAFGLENQAVPRDEIWPRVRRALDESAFPYPEGHPTFALSGGETQRLAIASSLVLASRLLLLDEPTSMLDAPSAATVVDAVRRFVDDNRPTLVVAEHQVGPWIDLVDRIVVLGAGGRIVADGEPREVLDREGRALAGQGVWAPGLAPPEPDPIDESLVRPWRPGPSEVVRAERVGLDLVHRLTRRAAPPTPALRDVDASLRSGRVLAVTGASGAGKSSLISLLAGLRAPTAGRVRAADELATRRGASPHRWRSRDLAARLAWVPQFPEHGVVSRSVRDEMLAAARACGRDESPSRARAEGLLKALGLSALADASPYHLSGGEQRRLMVGAALAAGAYGVLLDEPTVGQDRLTWAAVTGALAAARSAGAAVAIATHDRLAVDALADDRLELAAGRVAS